MSALAYCDHCLAYREIPVDKQCPICARSLNFHRTLIDPVDGRRGLERKETIYYDKPKTGTESSSVPAPKSVLSDEEFDKLVTQHSMPSLADIYKKGLKQNVLRPVAAYAHKN